jgi:RNA polymerase sigma-70 factor, ECF subfamily
VERDEDAELMLRVAAGDQRAFAALFDRYQQSICRFAFRFVGEKARAEELAQDIFVKLFQSAKSYRPSAKFKTYLFRVATNHCLNEVRRTEYRVSAPMEQANDSEHAEPAAADGARPDQALEGAELERAVAAALASMSDRERAAFSLCRFEGMAYRDIAFALSASEAAVKSLIHRATLAVAKKVEELEAGLLPARSRA